MVSQFQIVLAWFNSLNLKKYLVRNKCSSTSSDVSYREFLQAIDQRKVPTIAGGQGRILVSIILVVSNDLKRLKKTIPSILKNTENIHYEIIAIDNASVDGSVAFLQSYRNKLPLKVIDKNTKISFSSAINQAAEISRGKYLVPLKVGVEPLTGWLNYLVCCAEQEGEGLGVLGARLVSPCLKSTFPPLRKIMSNNDTFYHMTGIAFSDETTFYRPYYFDEKIVIDELVEVKSIDRSAMNTSCLLIPKRVYQFVNGLDEQFVGADSGVELALTLHSMGYTNKCSTNAVLIDTLPSKAFWKIKSSSKDNNDCFILQKKWFQTVKRSYWREKILGGKRYFSEAPLTIAIAVTDHGDGVTAGDYFTAQELASAVKTFGWEVIFLSRKQKEWYKIPEKVDVLLNLLDAYDLDKIPPRKKRLVKIAWARNWFDRWCKMPCFKEYDIVFSSSQMACRYINENSGQDAQLLPIASNPDRFSKPPECANHPFYKSEICFTGSYWDYPRDIIKGLSQEVLDNYSFSIFGAHWEKVDKLKKYTKGFLDYDDIPCVYHQTKIVIDDANHVTKPYGSVNSRVFDAIMSGALVITNGAEGSKELFRGELPFYEDQAGLTRLIKYYLNNEGKRIEKIQQLREIVSERHTYQQRAKTVKKALIDRFLSPSIAIKVPAPNWKDAPNWGDYHMAVSLKQALEREGFRVIIQLLPEWDNQEGNECDSVIVLRGLSRYVLKDHQLNILWNISHPDKVSLEEYEEYDQVFIASELWAKKVAEQVSVPVEVMLQCTNPDVFYEPSPEEKITYKQQLLFVGNSRKVYRKTMRELLPTSYDLSVYGNDWKGLIPSEYIKGEHIPNGELYRYYGSADVLLNDHWDDMCEKGFISNRIFDGLACGALIVTDRVEGMGDLEDYVVVYDETLGLEEVLDGILGNPDDYKRQSDLGRKYINKEHTFEHRAKQFSRFILTHRKLYSTVSVGPITPNNC